MENNQKTEPDSCFDGYGLSGEITETLTLLGYEHPTRVQEEVLPHVLAGRNVVVRSQTGTGKTAAFGIPLLQKVDPKSKKLQAIILCPTRELAIQVSEEIRRLQNICTELRFFRFTEDRKSEDRYVPSRTGFRLSSERRDVLWIICAGRR